MTTKTYTNVNGYSWGMVHTRNDGWAYIHDFTGNVSGTNSVYLQAENYTSENNYYIRRYTFKFDQHTDKIPVGSIITSVIVHQAGWTNPNNAYCENPSYSCIVGGAGLDCSNQDYHKLLTKTTKFHSVSYDSGNGDKNCTLNADGVAEIQSQILSSPDYLYLGWRVSQDIDNQTPAEHKLDDYQITLVVTIEITYAGAVVTTLPATDITYAESKLNGNIQIVGGSATVYFNYATDAYYTGHGSTYDQTTGDIDVGGASSIDFSQLITGLSEYTTYHFRAIGEVGGVTDYGADLTFTMQHISSYTFIENTLEISSVLGQTISTLRGTIHDKTRSLTIVEDTDIVEYDISTGLKIFAGIISYITDYTDGIERYFDLICQDYSILLDRSLVYAPYPAGFTYTVGGTTYVGDVAIIMDLFQNRILQPNGSANGQLGASEIIIDPALVNQGITGLTALNFFYMTLRECLELLANYVNFDYYVDYDKKLHYFYTPSNHAPFGLSSSPDGTTTLGYHGLKRKIDGTRVVNNFMVIGTQLFGNDVVLQYNNNGISWAFFVSPKGNMYYQLGAPSTTTTGLIRVFTNTGTDLAPTWTELTNGGIYGVNESALPPVVYDWLYDESFSNLYFKTPPPKLTKSWQVEYALILNGGLPDSIPESITKYGRPFSTRLIAQDANSAAAIYTNLAHLKAQFGYGLQILTLSIDSVDFPPGLTRFDRGQYVHLVNAILGIDNDYWVHAITTKVSGGTVVSYDLELRNYSIP